MARRNVHPSAATAVALLGTPLLAIQSAAAQDWIRQFGTAQHDQLRAITTDGAGGTIAVGHTEGSLFAANAGSADGILIRHDSLGNTVWQKQFGGAEGENLFAIAPLGNGDVVVGGHVGNLMYVEVKGYLSRIDSLGNEVWTRTFANRYRGATVNALVVDSAGSIFVAGDTGDSLGGTNMGSNDVFIAKYDGDGRRLWITQFGSPRAEGAFSIALGTKGDVFVSGLTAGSLGGPSLGNWDVFIARHDSTGTQQWIRQIGSNLADIPLALCPDGAGGAVVAGYTEGDFGSQLQGATDCFLVRYDSSGNQLWINQFGTESNDAVYSAVNDGSNGIIIAGETGGVMGRSNSGEADVFISRFDNTGKRDWITQFGSSRSDTPMAITTSANGSIALAGVTFGGLGGAPAGRWDVFVARFDEHPCFADCDPSTGARVLDIFDYLCFVNSFVLGYTIACDCDTSTGRGVCDIFDFLCFQDAFLAGCP